MNLYSLNSLFSFHVASKGSRVQIQQRINLINRMYCNCKTMMAETFYCCLNTNLVMLKAFKASYCDTVVTYDLIHVSIIDIQFHNL